MEVSGQIPEEILDSFYKTDEDYSEQLMPMKHTHHVFELAIELQLQANTVKSAIDGGSVDSMLRLLKERTSELDGLLVEAELFDQPVVLSGPGIR